MKLAEIPIEDVQEAVEKMQAEDKLVEEIALLKTQVAYLMESAILLTRDYNERNASKP